jgi:hypothetical protein
MNMVGTGQQGFFKSLFDFSFKTFITPKIIKVIYGIVMVLAGLGALVFVVLAFRVNPIAGIFVLVIIAPLEFLIYVIMYRVLLEVVMAIFAIASNTGQMAASMGSPQGSAGYYAQPGMPPSAGTAVVQPQPGVMYPQFPPPPGATGQPQPGGSPPPQYPPPPTQ